MSEYSEALGSAEYKMYLNLFKAVELAKADYEIVIFLIGAGRKKGYIKSFCDDLNAMLKTKYEFEKMTVPEFLKQMDVCERRAAILKIKRDLKINEFEAVKNKMGGGKSVELNKNYFTSVLIILSKHNNYRITKDIFVNEYCEYLKQFNHFCDLENKK